MEKMSFEQRVVDVAIAQAKLYQTTYVEWEYLICSKAFHLQDYYIIAARPDNYQHLIGVHARISPIEFYNKCLEGTLSTMDFDFCKPKTDTKTVKGSVRRKINSLPYLMTMMTNTLFVQESFVKNKIACTFATSEHAITAGFIGGNKSRPMTLLWKNQLEMEYAQVVDLILRRQVGKPLFHEVVIGTPSALSFYIESLAEIVTPTLHVDIVEEKHHAKI